MELALCNHSSYPRIGDDPEHQLLRRTLAQHDKGEKTEEAVRAAQDRMTELALAEQTEAGLDLVTDGQIRWADPISHLAGKLSGVRVNGLVRFFDTNFYFRQPVAQGRPERREPLLLEEFKFAQEKSARPVKAVLTGPYTLARFSVGENGGSGSFEKMLEGYTAALAAEIAALAAAGATVIQIEEPALLKYPEDFPRFEQCLSALAMSKDSSQLALAIYFGDPAALYDQLQTLPVDILGLDFTYSPGLVDRVISSGTARILMLGLVDGRNTRLEDPAATTRQLEKLARGAGLNRAYLSPSCGLEYLPRDRARQKLKQLAVIRNTFLGSPS
jgi:5-methyltetrahydropteroyltriglutamate--homocysteine methyltransferase